MSRHVYNRIELRLMIFYPFHKRVNLTRPVYQPCFFSFSPKDFPHYTLSLIFCYNTAGNCQILPLQSILTLWAIHPLIQSQKNPPQMKIIVQSYWSGNCFLHFFFFFHRVMSIKFKNTKRHCQPFYIENSFSFCSPSFSFYLQTCSCTLYFFFSQKKEKRKSILIKTE